MKVIIAGCREGPDVHDVVEAYYSSPFSATEIVSGHAKGADKAGEEFAKEHKIPVKLFPADWDQYGKGAGFIRNKQMADYADALVALWDGKSKGTAHMIKTMQDAGKPVFVWRNWQIG